MSEPKQGAGLRLQTHGIAEWIRTAKEDQNHYSRLNGGGQHGFQGGQIAVFVSRVDEILGPDQSRSKEDFDHRILSALSQREFQVWACLRHPVRRREWLAARLLVKLLILTGAVFPEEDKHYSIPWRPVVRFVGHENIMDHDPVAYRSVEFFSPTGGGIPRLFVGREDTSQILSCSLSHAGGWVAAACAAEGHPVGVDIETVGSHSADFQAGCFTEREQSWAEQIAAASDMSCDVIYTLLWTLKESAYKAVSAHRGFPWHVEVSMKFVMSSPLSEFIQDGGLLELSRYDLEVCINGWHRAQGATCRIASDCLLSVINILERRM